MAQSLVTFMPTTLSIVLRFPQNSYRAVLSIPLSLLWPSPTLNAPYQSSRWNPLQNLTTGINSSLKPSKMSPLQIPQILLSRWGNWLLGLSTDIWTTRGQERKNIDAGNEQDPVVNTHPHSHSLSIKDLSLTLKANTTTTTECAFGLPPQRKRSASKPEAYGHCQVFKNPTITPSAWVTTLDPLHSHTAMSRGLSSTLSSRASTGIGTQEPDSTLVGFREAKFEFEFTDIFVGIFKEVGAVDLALKACLARMGPFRWAAVSAVKIAFPPF